MAVVSLRPRGDSQAAVCAAPPAVVHTSWPQEVQVLLTAYLSPALGVWLASASGDPELLGGRTAWGPHFISLSAAALPHL